MAATPTDRTFDDVSRYGSLKWLAAAMGLSIDQLRARLPRMYNDGLPKPDLIIGHYIKADVDAWIVRRRKFSNADADAQDSRPSQQELDERRKQIIERI
jgi:hypothetical protein